jgi:hypothetical protein
MAVTATPIFPQAVNVGLGTIVNGDGTTTKAIFTAGANGSKLEMLTVSSTDTSNRDVNIFLTRSATNYLLATVQIPLNSGNANNVAAVDILRSTMLPGLANDAMGNRILYLKSGDTLTFAATTTVTSGKQITAVAHGGDY